MPSCSSPSVSKTGVVPLITIREPVNLTEFSTIRSSCIKVSPLSKVDPVTDSGPLVLNPPPEKTSPEADMKELFLIVPEARRSPLVTKLCPKTVAELDTKDNVLIEPVTNVIPLVRSESPETSAELEIIVLFLIAPETWTPALVLNDAPKISPELDMKEPF